MKAQRLRLGNLFLEQNSKEIISVIGLENNRIIFSGMFLDNWQAEPILLTEEWLLNLGYKPYQGHYIIIGHLVWRCNDLLMCEKNGIILKNVHQLQNLYFALTGHELILKQP